MAFFCESVSTNFPKRKSLLEGKDGEKTLTKTFQDNIDDIFEDKRDDKDLDGKKLDLDKMSGRSGDKSLAHVCMDLMLYDSPELFEAAFSLLRSQYYVREPVFSGLQEVMLIESTELFYHSNARDKKKESRKLQVCWRDPKAVLDDDDAQSPDEKLEVEQCEAYNVRHLQSFRQLLRRGVESYELWGIVDEKVEKRKAKNLARASTKPKANKVHTWFTSDGEMDTKRTWLNSGQSGDPSRYMRLLAYLTLFMKFQLRDETTESGEGLYDGHVSRMSGNVVLIEGEHVDRHDDFDFGDFDLDTDRKVR